MSGKLAPGLLTRRQAEKEILAILARVPDGELPKPDRFEQRDDNSIMWFGGTGHYVRPITSTGRRNASMRTYDVFEREAVERERIRRFGKGYEFRDGKQTAGVTASEVAS